MRLKSISRRACAAATTFALIALIGCATMPGESGEAARARAVAEAWQAALARQDFDAALGLVADDFQSERWPQKSDLAYYFQQAREREFFADASIPKEPIQASVDGDEAVAYPVPIRARLGHAVYRLQLERRENGWTIVSATQELY